MHRQLKWLSVFFIYVHDVDIKYLGVNILKEQVDNITALDSNNRFNEILYFSE